MKIGIVGVGVVGGAVKYGFLKLGHDVYTYDIKNEGSRLVDVLGTDICYICVPTPENEDGSCNTSIVGSTIDQLYYMGYRGIIAIKSTVVPGTTEKLIGRYPRMNICFVPEFLRERCAEIDFIENHDICIIGTNEDSIYNMVKTSHGRYPKNFYKLTPTEAELCKYFNNTYNATLVTFANSFFEVCKAVGVNYTNVKNVMVNREHITDKYLDCNKEFRGFGGMCLPKDTAAIAKLCIDKNIDVDFFMHLLEENNKYEITVYEGMRK